MVRIELEISGSVHNSSIVFSSIDVALCVLRCKRSALIVRLTSNLVLERFHGH